MCPVYLLGFRYQDINIEPAEMRVNTETEWSQERWLSELLLQSRVPPRAVPVVLQVRDESSLSFGGGGWKSAKAPRSVVVYQWGQTRP